MERRGIESMSSVDTKSGETSLPFSIVIRTLNSVRTLEPVLTALAPRKTDELILVDSGSTDGTLDLAAGFQARIVPIAREEFTYGRALNYGFAKATRDWVLVLSAHTVPMQPGFLDLYSQAISRFSKQVTAAVGPLVTVDFESPLPGGITVFRLEDFQRGFGFPAGNPNCVYRRTAWEHRPFDEEIGGGEDLKWYVEGLQAGEEIAAVHRATVRYISTQSARAFYRKGRVDFRASSQYIEPHVPSLGGLAIRAAKMLLFTCLGRADWPSVRGSLAHCLGTYIEARALRKSGKSAIKNENG